MLIWAHKCIHTLNRLSWLHSRRQLTVIHVHTVLTFIVLMLYGSHHHLIYCYVSFPFDTKMMKFTVSVAVKASIKPFICKWILVFHHLNVFVIINDEYRDDLERHYYLQTILFWNFISQNHLKYAALRFKSDSYFFFCSDCTVAKAMEMSGIKKALWYEQPASFLPVSLQAFNSSLLILEIL